MSLVFHVPQVVSGVQLRSKIGEGSFGCVYEGLEKESNRRVAVKIISKEYLKQLDMIDQYKNVTDIQSKLHHPNVIELYRIEEDQTNFYQVMELAQGCNMWELLNSMGTLTEDTLHLYILQLIQTIHYLHKDAGIIHRDIKLENIIVDKDDNIKLIDFGLATSINEDISFTCGSGPYLAPEMIEGRSHTAAVDIWCVGVVIYTMIYGHFPFQPKSNQKLYQSILYSDPKFDPIVSDSLIDLMARMLTKDHEKRITINDVLEHKWVKSHRDHQTPTNSLYESKEIFRLEANDKLSDFRTHIIGEQYKRKQPKLPRLTNRQIRNQRKLSLVDSKESLNKESIARVSSLQGLLFKKSVLL